MNEGKIAKQQQEFFARGDAGCKFAEHVAQDQEGYKWAQRVFETTDVSAIDDFIKQSENDDDISMVSIIFPNVNTKAELETMINTLVENSEFVYLDPETAHNDFRLIHMRAKIHGKISWISGFAPLEFMPKTRQAIHTEITFRVKDRPQYQKSIQPEPPEGTIHVADLEVPDMNREQFTKAWQESFSHTTETLGHPADELSAAKTTFILPK